MRVGTVGRGLSGGVAELRGNNHILGNIPQLLPAVCIWLSLIVHLPNLTFINLK